MPFLGKKPSTGFTQVPNQEIIYNTEISMKAKLIWIYLYSKPEGYQFSFDRIAKDMKEGEVTIRNTLKELETYGILERKKLSTGRVVYYLSFEPGDNKTQEAQKPGDRNAKLAKSLVGKSITISNTDNYNNTEFNNNTDISSEKEFSQDKVLAKEINEIIDRFRKTLSPSLKFQVKAQRKACAEMINRWGYERVLEMVDKTIEIQGDQYAPVVTTPHQMWANIGRLAIYFKRESNANKSNVLDLSQSYENDTPDG